MSPVPGPLTPDGVSLHTDLHPPVVSPECPSEKTSCRSCFSCIATGPRSGANSFGGMTKTSGPTLHPPSCLFARRYIPAPWRSTALTASDAETSALYRTYSTPLSQYPPSLESTLVVSCTFDLT